MAIPKPKAKPKANPLLGNRSNFVEKAAKKRSIKAKHFFDSAFKEFSLADNIRSIPTLIDGLKPSQRKTLYGFQVRGENAAEIQVERVAAFIASVTDYHHGIGSLEGTITGMAEDYPGANNMNLLMPNGQFGSRLTKEAAAGRYIFTKFHENFRKLFPKEDDLILEHHYSDGDKIEPKHYLPLLPMTLVNGGQGTGTGHACFIMAYNPADVRDACLKVLSGKKLPMDTLTPWYRGFDGEIERVEDTGQVVVYGKLEVVNSNTILITQLPIGIYLDQYKEFLNTLEDRGFIKHFDDMSTERAFEFKVTAPASTTALDYYELLKRFKLISRDTENFTMWNENGILERFDTAEDVVERFTKWRVGPFEVRRQKQISIVKEDIRWLNEKLRFILFYLDNVTNFKNKKKDDLIELLIKNNFIDYDRLLAMPIWSLTRDKIEELKNNLEELAKKLATLEADTAVEMFKRELKALTF